MPTNKSRAVGDALDGMRIRTMGLSGYELILYLLKCGIVMGETVQEILATIAEPTKQCYRIRLLRGDDIDIDQRTTQGVAEIGAAQGWRRMPLELVPYVRTAVSDDILIHEGLLKLVPFHTPVRDGRNRPFILGLFQWSPKNLLGACNAEDNRHWLAEDGFLFWEPF